MALRTGKVSGSKSIPVGVGFGAISAIIWTILAAGILAKLIETERVGEEWVGYGSMTILITAAMAGTWIANSSVKNKRIQVSILTGLTYYLFLLSVTAVFFGGQFYGMGATAMIIFGGSIAVAVLGLRKGKSRQRIGYKK